MGNHDDLFARVKLVSLRRMHFFVHYSVSRMCADMQHFVALSMVGEVNSQKGKAHVGLARN
jgi:hypothetical protein